MPRTKVKTLCGWFREHYRAAWTKICALNPATCSTCVLNKQAKGLK